MEPVKNYDLDDFLHTCYLTETEKLYQNHPIFWRSKSGVICEAIVRQILEESYTIHAPNVGSKRTVASTECDFMIENHGIMQRVEVKSSYLLYKNGQWLLRYKGIKKDNFDLLIFVALYDDMIIIYQIDPSIIKKDCIDFFGPSNSGAEASKIAIKNRLAEYTKYKVTF